MSTSGNSGGAAFGTRRTMLLVTLAVLVMVVGGLGVMGPGAASALAPLSSSHHALRGGLGPLAWTPLTIGSFKATPTPTYLGSPTTISASVSGGHPNYDYSYSYSGTAPTGTGCSPADTITSLTTNSFVCTPTATGNFSLILSLNDTPVAGHTFKNATQAQTWLNVSPLTITSFTATPDPANLGAPVTFSSIVLGASGAVTYLWTGLPAGCVAPATGSLACTPTGPGTSTVTLQATDASSATSSKTLSLVVTPVHVSTFTASPSTIYDGQWTNLSTVVAGVSGVVVYSYAGLPTNSPLCLSQNLATLPCMSRTAGSFPVTVTARDAAGDTSTGTATLTVKPLTVVSLVITPSPAFQGQTTIITTTAFGYFGAPTFTFANLSASGCAVKNLSTFTCIPTVHGTFNVTVTVSDWTGNHSTSAVKSLLVNPVAQPDFYAAVNTSFADQPIFKNKALGTYNQLCYTTNNSPFYSSTCSSQAADPSILTLSGGVTGVAYSMLTVNTSSTCPSATTYTTSLVAFSRSTTSGQTFNHRTMVGNFALCQYIDAIEPSFGVGAGGEIFGVFVEYNSSQLPWNYGPRPGDALAFVTSSDGGLTFSAATTIDAAGNIALPQIAVYGRTIYVAYEDIANTTTITGGIPAIAVHFISSTNAGGSWSTVSTLPGLNKGQGFNAMSPSIAVSATGTVAVAYATNRDCIAPLYTTKLATCLRFGENVTVVTSTTNGSAWSAPSLVASGLPTTATTNTPSIGETTCYSGPCYSNFFQSTPDTAVTFSNDGSRLFVAWAGTANLSTAILPIHSNLWYRWTVVGVSQSSNLGTTWTGGPVSWARVDTTTLGANMTNYYRPAIGVSGSMVYLTYSEDNETPATASFPGPFDNSYTQWITNASIGASSLSLSWWRATPSSYVPVPGGRLTNFTRNSFTGSHSAIGFTSTGTPLVGYSMVKLPISSVVSRTGYYSVNATYATNLTIAEPATFGMAAVTNVTFQAVGLPPTANWQFEIDNQIVTAVDTASLLLTNVPKGVPVFVYDLPYLSGYGVQSTQSINAGPIAVFYGSASTVTLTYTISVLLNQFFAPSLGGVSACTSGTFCYVEYYHFYDVIECLPGGTCNPTPWLGQGSCTYYSSSSTNCYYMYFYNYTEIELSGGRYYNYTYSYINMEWYDAAGTYHYVYGYCQTYPGGSYQSGDCRMWLPIGFQIAGYGEAYTYQWPSAPAPFVTYANGTGTGSYTGPAEGNTLGSGIWGGCATGVYGDCPAEYFNYLYEAPTCYSGNFYWCNYAPIFMYGPVNETLWLLPASTGAGLTYPAEITTTGLPSGSQYSFVLDGTMHTARAPNDVILSAVSAGSHTITGAQAQAPVPGWAYYATATSFTIPQQSIVTLSFNSYVEVGAAARSVTFHATNVTSGSIWRLEVNGTTYSSSTPDLTVSLKPGNYTVGSWSLTSTTGDAIYTPHFPGSLDLRSSTSVSLSFVPSYRVQVTATIGGTVALGTTKGVSSASGWYAAGATAKINETASAGYTFLGWSGTGTGSYTGTTPGQTLTVSGPIEDSASFFPQAQARFNLTFVAVGLPAGVWWTVYVNGVGYSSDQTFLTVPNAYPYSQGAIGHYSLLVGISYLNSTTNNTRFLGSGPAWVSTNGTASSIPISFSPQYLVNVQSTPGGSVAVTNGNLVIATEPFWAPGSSTVTIQATAQPSTPQGHWVFLGWNGTGSNSYNGTNSPQTLIAGGPISEIASFLFVQNPPAPRYTFEVIQTTTLAAGTSWTVQIGTQTFSSTTQTLNATGLLGETYSFSEKVAFSPDGTTRYVPPSNTVTSISVPGTGSQKVSFGVQYWVSIQNTTGGAVSAAGSGGNAVSLAGWFTSGTQLTITATPNGNNLFTFWNGSGPGAYTGASPTQAVTVTGSISEVAAFVPPVPPALHPTGFFASTPAWILLAIVGLAVGLGVGLLIFRGRGRSPPPPPMRESSQPSVSEVTESAAAPPEYVEDQGGDQ